MPDQKKILIVDDDLNFCKSLSKILEAEGCAITIAGSGFQAMDWLRRERFDVVLMDIRMPHVDGLLTYGQMKELRPGLKVILISAYYADGVAEKAKEDGVHAVFSKPLDIKALIRTIKELK